MPYYRQKLTMNIKRTFGTILTVLGIAGLVYAAIGFLQNTEGTKQLIVFASLGMIFFFTGISLVKGTKDNA